MKERLESKYYAVVVILKSVCEGNEPVALERLHFLLEQSWEDPEPLRTEAWKQLAKELNVLLYYRTQEYKVNFQKSHELYRQLDRQLDCCRYAEPAAEILEQMICSYISLIRTGSRRHFSNLIRNCLDHIDQNFTETVTVQSEAARLNVSRSYLSHRFVQETGFRLTDYVNDLRVRYACTLLENLQFPIQRVAEVTGFSTANYFARAFRTRIGMSPREYRELRQKRQARLQIDPEVSIN